MEALLSSRNKTSNSEVKEVSRGGLYRLTNQVEGIIAFARLFERVENCEQEEVLE